MAAPPTITPGQTVIFEIATEDDPERHTLRVEAVQDDEIVLVSPRGRFTPTVLTGILYRMVVLTNNTLYNLDCEVVRRSTTSLRVKLAPDADRISRRQYVRVVAEVPMSCLILNDRSNQWSQFHGRITDISAGGMAMAANTIAPVGATIAFSIGIPGERPVVAIGRVLPTDTEIRKVVQISVRGPAVRVEFTLIREVDRDRLMRFIFSEMIRRRREELDAQELLQTDAD